MYEISAQEYLIKLKDYKSYFKRCKKVLFDSSFWPANKLHELLKYESLGINVIGPMTILQSARLSLPKSDRSVRKDIQPYRVMTPVDRAILGCHIVIAINKRNGMVKVCHTYEDENVKNPIKPLNEAIKDLEEGIETNKIARSTKIQISGTYEDGPLKYPVYRIVTYSNDTMTYPNVIKGRYGLEDTVYNEPVLTADEILEVFEDLKRLIGHLKEES